MLKILVQEAMNVKCICPKLPQEYWQLKFDSGEIRLQCVLCDALYCFTGRGEIARCCSKHKPEKELNQTAQKLSLTKSA